MIGDYYVDIDKVGPDLFHWSPHYVIMRVSDLVIGGVRLVVCMISCVLVNYVIYDGFKELK